MILYLGLDRAGGFRHRQPLLGLPLKLRFADEQRQHDGDAVENVVGGHPAGALIVGELTIPFQTLGQGSADAGDMATAFGRRHRITVGVDKPIAVGGPANRPLHLPLSAIQIGATAKNRCSDQGPVANSGA